MKHGTREMRWICQKWESEQSRVEKVKKHVEVVQKPD